MLAAALNHLPFTRHAYGAGLEPDPRFPELGTIMVFRRKPDIVPKQSRIDAFLAPAGNPPTMVSSAAYLLSGRWLVDIAHRGGKAVRDAARKDIAEFQWTSGARRHELWLAVIFILAACAKIILFGSLSWLFFS
ncbi:hypothetical protein [Bosea sp. LC85]|uniref:hypothetical protein n=1 Tax=Bosea sp. LC85 TaxID=1502851 RepID=UPI0005BDF027|nr:hypothetical protein [Bosea sp. LC85]